MKRETTTTSKDTLKCTQQTQQEDEERMKFVNDERLKFLNRS